MHRINTVFGRDIGREVGGSIIELNFSFVRCVSDIFTAYTHNVLISNLQINNILYYSNKSWED